MNEMTSNTRALIRDAAGISDNVSSYSEELMTFTDEMKDGIEQVSATSEELASGSTNQAEHASETLVKIQRVDYEVKQINQHTEKMTQQSLITKDSSQRGIQNAEQAMEQMKMIEERVSSTAHIVQELGERSKQINQILEVINDIASQTNLLSLNAAIEAARAGEHGKGFAVVADEVRKLAEQSSVSTSQISTIIEMVQKEVQEVEQAIKGVVAEVQSGSNVIESNREAFNEIAKNVSDMINEMNKVAYGSKQIDQETSDAVKAVENIAAISQQSSAGSEELSATMEQQSASMQEIDGMARNLAELAESLNQSLAKFKY
ncbi:methyl-accepting chemotaxis protein [Bacillus sp. CGMCC 1.16607]|uniref:methyl-accepting chemotaxis protein n=1 Tax=Bacillus sp. CGMCC 1.16607 TaxID=3351842 RepID=UPI00363B1902